MEKTKIGNKTFNSANIAFLEVVTNADKVTSPDEIKQWVKVAMTAKSKNEKGYMQNDSVLIEFDSVENCNSAIENA